MTDICYEVCPECEYEVPLENAKVKTPQKCPHCNKYIMPCSLCEDCDNSCNWQKLNRETGELKMKENIIQKIIDNKDKIVGIRFNGIFYDVDFVGVDGQDCYDQFSRYDTIISAHQVDEFDCVLKYEFRVGNIQDAQDVKLYKLEEI